ncbi:type II toxin-antitoxin system RelE/ParE family toxin [Mucilaginibacter flavidus]|uniref:type II toxin-antitoxin system RelE/ParE family toxin n=1 Tax=Mucilaginibacter flavidus TaxID=2949309 RepID=UPI0020939AB4|nr:type II toxin-antitoxin system RelE/ParE family toxin [Mucilaginibacter flavidus]MCO5950841.1 type II toxin-antitoxin system RelE/ParE family toxin [Mucilaginibacter flavidus]
MSFEFRTIPNFDRELKKLAKKYPSIKQDVSELAKSLIENPFQGESLGKNCFKVRMKITSKMAGKSGGSRVITCVKVLKERITLVSIYDKSDMENISDNFLDQVLADNGLI